LTSSSLEAQTNDWKQEGRRTEQKNWGQKIQKAKPSFVFVPGFKQNRQTPKKKKKNKKTEGSGTESRAGRSSARVRIVTPSASPSLSSPR
jgi:hypothetical protein